MLHCLNNLSNGGAVPIALNHSRGCWEYIFIFHAQRPLGDLAPCALGDNDLVFSAQGVRT